MSYPDRRIKHTKQFLKTALLELLEEKPLSQISVTALCNRADINRNTFYCHYHYPEEILWEMQQDVLEQFQTLFDEKQNGSQLILHICQALKTTPHLYYIIFKSPDDHFFNQLVSLSHDQNIDDWQKMTALKGHEIAEKFYRFTLAGATSIIRSWCENGYQESPEEITQFILDLSMYGMEGLLKSR